MQETWVPFLGGENSLEKEMATHFQYSCLRNPMDRETWRATVYCCSSVAHLCLILCDPMDCSLPGSSVHGISQARILEWGLPSPGDLPRSGIKPTFPALAGRFFLPLSHQGSPTKGYVCELKTIFIRALEIWPSSFSLSQWSLPEATWLELLREIE